MYIVRHKADIVMATKHYIDKQRLIKTEAIQTMGELRCSVKISRLICYTKKKINNGNLVKRL